jgi:hypothetical protein
VGGNRTVYDDGSLVIRWNSSYVYRYPKGRVPLWWRVNVTYINTSEYIIYLTCKGMENPKEMREHFYRNRRHIGHVSASETMCSRNPKWIASLGPHRRTTSWALFHNVPWKGDLISIEWSYLGRSAFNDPYARRLPG